MSPQRRRRRMRSRATQSVIALLCGLVGFTAVAQAMQSDDALAGLRQADLVRLLDEINSRIDQLSTERDSLQLELDELRSGVSSQEAAVAAAEEQVRVRSIQAGVVPVHGPGVEVTIEDPNGRMSAQSLVTIVEELRNAGAEAIDVDGVRFGTASWVVAGDDGPVVDGEALSSPYVISAIGDPQTLSVALDMPGGVLAAIRATGATTTLVTPSDVRIESVVEPAAPEHLSVTTDG